MTRNSKRHVAQVLILLLAAGTGTMAPPAGAQGGKFKEMAIKVAVCGGGTYGGLKLGEKLAEFEAKRLSLAGEQAAQYRRSLQIGMAMALCGGGVLVANTTFQKLSERDRKARETELDAAVREAAPRSYLLPDHPDLRATATPQPIVTEGNQECRMVEDVLADGVLSDRAVVKFCRPVGGDNWKVVKY